MTSREVGECIGIYYDDPFLDIVVDAIKQDFKESIPGFNENNMTSRQKILLVTYSQDIYDNRVMYEEKKGMLRATINSMLLKEYYKKVSS